VLFLAMLAVIPLMDYMGQEKEVIEESKPYFFVIAISIIPLMLFYNFKQFNEGVESTKPTMYIALGSNALNVFLNYLFIYGHWGFPEMGLLGAGYATLISRIVMAIALAVYTLKAPFFAPFVQEMKNTRIRLSECLKIYRIGIPIAGQMLMEVTLFALGAIMIGWIGKNELAAHQAIISVAALTYMIANGLAAGTTIRVSNQLGKGNFIDMRKAAHVGIAMGVVFMTVTAILFVLFRQELPALFVKDDEIEVIMIGAQLMVIAGFFQLFDGIQVVALGALRGLHDVKIPTFLTFIAYWVLGMPTCYLLAFTFGIGVEGIWYGFLVGLGSASVLLAIRFEKTSKKIIAREQSSPKNDEESAVEVNA